MNRKSVLVILLVLVALVMNGVGAAAHPANPANSPAAQPTARPAVPQPPGPVGSSFTYQGQLGNNGSPANGQYDFTFTLYDGATAGTQIGSPILVGNQTVSNGLFTVNLDFGVAVFQGEARWLEI